MAGDTYTQQELEAVSLENCDSEPVHIPGQIQSFAVLLATDSDFEKIIWCSSNVAQLLGSEPNEILGQPLATLLGREFCHDLANTLSLSSAKVQRERVAQISTNHQQFEVWAHFSHGLPVMEFEPVTSQDVGQRESILLVRSLLARLSGLSDLDRALNDAVTSLRGLSGFDRVMLYQFDHNGDGEVKAESLSGGMEPYLGLRFPRWDIPKQAREIMRAVRLRVIGNVEESPSALVAGEHNMPPLDLTLAASRASSPIHLEYLSNMGVSGSMTLSIVVGDDLWGLIAFHHRTPRWVGPNLRGAAELFIQFFSLQLEQNLSRIRNDVKSVVLAQYQALQEAADSATSIESLVEKIAPQYCALLDAQGMAMISADSVANYGQVPEDTESRAIAKQLLKPNGPSLAAVDSLAKHGLLAGNAAGALAIRIDEDNLRQVVFYRCEAVKSVRWAGAPEKTIIVEKDQPRLKPRGSFGVYTQALEGHCKPWDNQTLITAGEIATALAKADASLYRRLTQKVERQRTIYIAELNHRVRNILALIRSLSRRAHESTHSLESYAKALEQRIEALGAAHDLAASKMAAGVEIGDIFETEAKPYLTASGNQLHLSGKRYLIRPDVAPIFALVVHELTTNCVKYGALSNADGSITVHMEHIDNHLKISWSEAGGPPVQQPRRRGFGLSLIEKAIPYELDGDAEVRFDVNGLCTTFHIPMDLIDPMPSALAGTEMPSRKSRPVRIDIPNTVLVVEDSLMVALDTAEMLERMGVNRILTCATIDQAMRELEEITPDCAIMDISLRRGTSFELAETLVARQIPFCFATGYGSENKIPEALSQVTVLTKPVDEKTLRTTVESLTRANSA
ncbi:MAG: HWE histidine kinase domain-containing protein [Lysobacterales bacterium]